MVEKTTLRHLRCFITIVREGGFTAAAGRLNTTPSSVSTTIAQLEEALGARLLRRTTRRMDLTSSGECFLPIAERLVQDFDLAIKDMRAMASGERGNLAVATVASMLIHVLRPAMAAFSTAHPGIRFAITDGVAEDVQQRVLTSEVDLGFTSRWRDEPALRFRPLLHDELSMVCRIGYALARRRGPVRWNELAGHAYIALPLDAGSREGIQGQPELNRLLQDAQYRASTLNMLQWLLHSVDGYSIVPSLVAGTPAFQGLVFRRLKDPVVERQLCLVTHRRRELSPAAQYFLHYVQKQIEQSKFPEGVRAYVGIG